MRKALTVRGVATMQPGPKRIEVSDALVSGLYLQVEPTGTKSWTCRYRDKTKDSKPTKKFLGRYPDLDLAGARDRARSMLQDVGRGREPSRSPDLVEEVVAQFVELHCKRHNKTWRAVEASLRADVVPRWQGRRITDITRRDVIALVDEVSQRAPIQSNRVLAQVKSLFAWCADRDVVQASPAAAVRPPTAEASRDRVLTMDEIRAVWRAAGAAGYPFGDVTKLLLLSGQRLREVAHMERREVQGDLWNLPAARSKNGRPNQVPLTARMAAILESARRIDGSPFYFSTTGSTPISGFSRAKRRLDELAGIGEDWHLHDLRRSCASHLARLGVSIAVIEKLLNHSGGPLGGMAGVYIRHRFTAEVRAALELWDAEVGG